MALNADLRLPPDPPSVSRARSFVTSTLHDWSLDPLAAVTALLTSEVVTNAIIHARSELTLSIQLDGRWLIVAAHDEDDRPPAPREPGPDSDGGRGLVLIGDLTVTWGVTPAPPGKAVWFVLDGTPSGDGWSGQ